MSKGKREKKGGNVLKPISNSGTDEEDEDGSIHNGSSELGADDMEERQPQMVGCSTRGRPLKPNCKLQHS